MNSRCCKIREKKLSGTSGTLCGHPPTAHAQTEIGPLPQGTLRRPPAISQQPWPKNRSTDSTTSGTMPLERGQSLLVVEAAFAEARHHRKSFVSADHRPPNPPARTTSRARHLPQQELWISPLLVLLRFFQSTTTCLNCFYIVRILWGCQIVEDCLMFVREVLSCLGC